MASLVFGNDLLVLRAFASLANAAPGKTNYDYHKSYIATYAADATAYSKALNGVFKSFTDKQLGDLMLTNLGLSSIFSSAQGEAYIKASAADRVGAVLALADGLANYTGTDAAVLAAKTTFNNKIDFAFDYSASNAAQSNFPDTFSTSTFTLTTGIDKLIGTANADLFMAYINDNSNSLQSNDNLQGGAGIDTLFADVGRSANFAITAVTTGIETVQIRAQATPNDVANGNNMTDNTVQIDAQRMSGVNQWESNNSRADVIIEDVRIADSQKTSDITVAFVESDPGNVDFGLYFNQASLRNAASGNTSLTINLMDTGAAATPATAATPLLNNPYDQFKLGINGVLTTIQLDKVAVAAADTYEALLTVFQSALTAMGSDVTVKLLGTFTINDPISTLPVTGKSIVITGGAGGVISAPAGSGWYNTTGASVPPTSNIYTTYTQGALTVTELVTSKVILDDVGMGSTGGDLVIGGMSVGETSTSRGVERFEIEVRDNSKLQTINGTNNALREVTIVSGVTSKTDATDGAYSTTVTNEGDLTVNGNVNTGNTPNPIGTLDDQILPGVNDISGVNSYAADHHSTSGFTDVRLIDASAFKGKLAFTSQITTDTIAKYVTLVDTAANPAGDVAGAGNVNFNVPGANFQYTGGNDNDTMVVTIDGGVTASRSNIISGQSDFTLDINSGEGNDKVTVTIENTAALNGGLQNWANNQDLNNNITINTGAGDDVIRTPGAGDTTIDAGDGNDVVYTDNTGRETIAATLGASNLADGTTSVNAAWVFNTWDQVNAVANGAARNINNLRSDANDSYNFYKGTVVVTFKGLPSATITLANAATYKTSDLEINQAIKNAINTDATLKNLLVAEDGPANTLVVKSLIDGEMAAADLTVTFAAPAATTVYTAAEIAGMATAYNNVAITTNALALAAQVLPSSKAAQNDYNSVFAQDAAGLNLIGADSTNVSDNFVSPGTGNDIIVLGTTTGADLARSSNEVVTLAAGFGNDVVLNFDVAGTGIDHLNMTAFLGKAAASVGGLAATDSLVTVVAQVAGTNDTDALVAAIIKASVVDVGVTAATKQVYVVVNAHNVGTVYSIVNGTAAGDSVVTKQGTVDLADVAWATLTAANYGTVGAQAEGASTAAIAATLTAIVNAQVLVGTSGLDTLNNGGFAGVTMTGLGAGDTFQVTGGTATITDLATGDVIVRTGGTVTAGATAATGVSAFTAFADTSNNGAAANVVINSLTAGSTINMALASGVGGYTLTGGAGNDTLTGSANADTITGGTSAVANADVLNGGGGVDTITAAVGALTTTTINGGAGDDIIAGGTGIDTINVTSGVDAITAFGTLADVITVSAGAGATVATDSAAWTALATSSNSGSLVFNMGVAGVLNLAAMGGSAGVTVNGFGIDTITGTANADVITTAGAVTSVTGGAGADTITLAAGIQTVVLNSGATADTVNTFTVGAGGDVVSFSVAGLNTTIPSGALVAGTAGAPAALAAGAVSLQVVAGAAAVAAGSNVFEITGATFATSALLETAIETAGTRALTFGAATTAGQDILVVWSDGANGHVGSYNIGTAATTLDASGTYTELATIVGVANAATLLAANFSIVA